MSETRLQRKRRENAEFWGKMFSKARDAKGNRPKTKHTHWLFEALAKNKQVEKRKRAQFRQSTEGEQT